MYVRVMRFVCRQDTEREDVQNAYRKVNETAQSHEGFIGSSLLLRADACEGMALFYWENEQAAASAGPALVSVIGEDAHTLLDGPPDMLGFDVVENGIIPDAGSRSA